MPTFSVAVMLRETPDLIDRFVRYYEALGAAEIFLFHDGPLAPGPEGDALRERLHGNPIVRLEEWTEDMFKDALGEEDAKSFHPKQSYLYMLAKQRNAQDWIFYCDADEFLIARGDVAELLSRVPKNFRCISVPVAEAVWGPGDAIEAPFGSTHFRRPIRKAGTWNVARRWLYGENGLLMENNCLGHALGKAFLRHDANADLIVSHRSYRNGKIIKTYRVYRSKHLHGALEVAHYDAVGLDRWIEKFRLRNDKEITNLNMRDARRRQAQIAGTLKDAAERGDRAAAIKEFRGLYGLTSWQYRALRFGGYAFQADPFAELGLTFDAPAPAVRPAARPPLNGA
ncbi:MAG: glycosyltransferase family 2 protein [Pseudomonadota bacterium]